jgi:hypothetical protein
VSDGIASYLAGKWLNWLAGNAETAPSSLNILLHTGDPGSAGTANESSVTTREAMTATVSGAELSSSDTPTWSDWAGTNDETDTDISIWDASSSGDFLDSIQLGSSVTLYTGDTLELTSVTITFTTAS